ncbi:hypothetical protein MHK_000799, partial [Candidatus Magnetomorum sp. HK-1]
KIDSEHIALIKSLIYLSAVPLHSHSQFEMYGLVKKGIDNFVNTRFYYS